MGGTWAFKKRYNVSRITSYGPRTRRIRRILWRHASPVNSLNTITARLQGFSVPSPFRHCPGNTCIFVVVDRFSKGLHLGMLPLQHTAHTVALLFIDMVGHLHGMPKSIISDRDPLFVSKFWRELFTLSGTKLRLSSAYHPQSDGQTEVANRIVEQYLRAFVHEKPATWDDTYPGPNGRTIRRATPPQECHPLELLSARNRPRIPNISQVLPVSMQLMRY